MNLLPILLAMTAATFLAWRLWSMSTIFDRLPFRIHPNSFIHRQAVYQLLFFGMALTVSAFSYSITNHHPPFFCLGQLTNDLDLDPLGRPLIWKSATPFLAMAFALATYLVVRPFLGTHAWAKAWPLRHAIILLAAANALSEELIYRTALLNVAYKTVPDGIAAAISALIFGLAHIHGQAKGWVVVLGSTACGYVFAVSVIQTQGLFVAWLLHFVQGMFFMAAFAVASADGSWATTSAGNETI